MTHNGFHNNSHVLQINKHITMTFIYNIIRIIYHCYNLQSYINNITALEHTIG